jgi:hypothetical protein
MVGGLLDLAALNLECGVDLLFSLEFTGADGTRHREPLAACTAERFEKAVPVRSFRWAKGTAHFPGSWWSSTTSAHVGFESWLAAVAELAGSGCSRSGPAGARVRRSGWPGCRRRWSSGRGGGKTTSSRSWTDPPGRPRRDPASADAAASQGNPDHLSKGDEE